MLVREVYTEVMRDPLTREILLDREGNPICIPGERWVEMAGIEDEASALQRTQAEAQVAATEGANESTITSKALAALAVNDTFLALGSPTNAQTLAQVKVLTKECSGLIRLLLRKLDSTAGT